MFLVSRFTYENKNLLQSGLGTEERMDQTTISVRSDSVPVKIGEMKLGFSRRTK